MTDTVSDEKLREIVALGEKATPGPWFAEEGYAVIHTEGGPVFNVAKCNQANQQFGKPLSFEECDANAAFIAASRICPDIARELLAAREAMKALVDDVRRRYPGEELRCPYMRAIAALLPEQQP